VINWFRSRGPKHKHWICGYVWSWDNANEYGCRIIHLISSVNNEAHSGLLTIQVEFGALPLRRMIMPLYFNSVLVFRSAPQHLMNAFHYLYGYSQENMIVRCQSKLLCVACVCHAVVAN